ncbi:MAG: DUF927 domain-containing protein [Methanosarcina mazei]
MAEKYLEINPEGIPQLLKDLNQWLVWKPVAEKGKKNKKVPFSTQVNPATGIEEFRAAAWNNPDTWMSFNDALAALKKHKDCKGLQFVLPNEEVAKTLECPHIVGVDFDNVTEESIENLDHSKLNPDVATFNPEKLAEIKALGTYAELSPSGHGLRALCLGAFPIGEEVHKNNVEVYQSGKILTITGHKIADVPATVEPAQEAITTLRAKYFTKIAQDVQKELKITPIELTDDEIIAKITNSKNKEYLKKFNDIYYNGIVNDGSEADWKLCQIFVFYTQKEEQVDRLIRGSKSFRPEKWDEGGRYFYGQACTYGQLTIRKVLMSRKEVYTGKSYESLTKVDLHPYNVTAEGIIKHEYVKTKDGYEPCEKVISSTPCTIDAIGMNVDNHNSILYKLTVSNSVRKTKSIWKANEDLLQRSGVLSLQNEGMVFPEAVTADMIDFFVTYINKARDTLPKEIAVNRNGWKENKNMFVYGKHGFTSEGYKEILQVNNPLVDMYTEAGSLQNWIEGVKDIFEYNVMRLKAYMSCAPIILNLLNVRSCLIEQRAPSGRLKSETSRICASMFGNPIELEMTAGSTKIGVLEQVNLNNCMPLYIDEVNMSADIRELVYLIANGKGRSKSNKNNGLVIGNSWTTVAVLTCEKPILPENANGGEFARVIPIEGIKERLPIATTQRIKDTYEQNYGHIGKLFVQKVIKNKDKIKPLYNEILINHFPQTDDITSERVKEYYAAIATAGVILEDVFAEIGITKKDAVELCIQLYTKNVLESARFEPDYIRALRATYSWYMRNELYFKEPETTENGAIKEINHERYGWIKIIDGTECICFDHERLKKQLKEDGYSPEGSIEDWKENNIVITKTVKKKDKKPYITALSVIKNESGKPTNTYAIPFSTFEKFITGAYDSSEKPSSIGSACNTQKQPKTLNSFVTESDALSVLAEEGL